MVVSIDKNLKPVTSRLYLCKPNRETIAELKDAYGKRIKFASNGIDELSFKVPYKVMRNNKYIKNKHIENVKGHYLIRYEEGDYKEYFIINKPIKSSDNGINVKDVSCKLLPYGLNDKIVRNYQGTKKLYDSVGTDGVLNDTLLIKADWSVGYVDADIALKYRTFDIPEKTLLEMMNELIEAYDCIIRWDTVNKQVNFYKPSSLGQNQGLSIEYGKYLKAITEEPNFDNVVTRLYVYGKDGMSINKQNPTGADYIESLSYYIYPFERDVNRNVIKHSKYMSDELCHAILDYQELLETKQGEFTTLLNDKNEKEELLLTKRNEKYALENELYIIEDDLVTANANGEPTADLITQKNNKQDEIDAKQSEINTVIAQLSIINTDINDIKSEVAIENNFTSNQIIERNNYIKEKAWSNEHYFDVEELYNEGKNQLEKINQPIIQYKIDIVDFLKEVRCKKDWNKLNKYDIVTIKYSELGIDIKAKIIEIDRDDDGNAINLTIANADDIRNGFIEYKDLIAKFSSSSTRVDMSKFKWDDTEANVNEIRDVIEGEWDATTRRIKAGVNESVEISRKGLTAINPDFPDEMVLINSGVVGVSSDGGLTFKNAITKNGVVAERVYGVLLAGTNLKIDASDTSGNKTFTVDELGTKINGMTLTIEGGDNGIALDPTTGLSVTRSDDKVKSIFNATDGIKIQVKEGTSFVDKFYYDTNTSRLVVDGEIHARSMKINGSDVLTADGLKLKGNYIDQITTDQLVAGTAQITTAMIETLEVGTNVVMGADATISWSNVTDAPTSSWVNPSYITSTKITSTTIESPSITGGSITSNTYINVGTDVYIGESLHLSGGGTRSIRFNGSDTWIRTSGDGLVVETLGAFQVSSSSRPLWNGTGLATVNDTLTAVWG